MSNCQTFIPALSIPSNSQHQQVYSQQGFVDLLLKLSESSVLYYCPYDSATLRGFFQQLSAREEVIALPQPIVCQFLSELKQRNRTQLRREAAYYQQLMKGQLQQGIQAMSRKELRKAMDRYDGELQILTHIMLENSKDAPFISCALVMQLIKQVREELENSAIPGLSITKLKTMRIGSDRQQEGEGGEGKEEQCVPIFQEIGEYEVKRLLDHLGCLLRRKLGFYGEFITDQQVRDDLQAFLPTLNSLEKAISEEIDLLLDSYAQLAARSEEFGGILERIESQQALESEIAQGLRGEVGRLREELAEAEARNNELQSAGEQWERLALTIQQDLSTASSHCAALEEQASNYRRNYEQVYAEYCKLAEQVKQKSLLAHEEQGKKIFASRSLKEQLEDTAQRLSRLLKEREQQRRQAKEKEEEKVNQIVLLEERIEELQRDLKMKNQNLCEYIRDSKLYHLSQSVIRISKISASQSVSSILEQTAKKNYRQTIKASEINQEPSNQQNENKVSNKQSQNILNNKQNEENSSDKDPSDRSSHSEESIVTLRDPNSSIPLNRLSRASKVGLAPVVPILQQDSSLEDFSEVYGQQNAVNVLQEDLEERPQEAFKKKNGTEISPAREKSLIAGMENSAGKYFFSRGVQMNVYGQKFETFLLMTSKRFCYFDTKMRLQKFVRVGSIKEFTFLAENPNLFILKPASPKPIPQHIVNDMIFLTRNASRLQAFLAQLRTTNKFAVTLRKGEHAWLRVHKEQYNLGMGVPSYFNPFRIALAGQPVFYGQLKQVSLWASKVPVVLVVQPMGIACFEAEQTYQLQSKREFLCLLPITEHLVITEKKNSKQAPDKKIVLQYGKAWDKCYQIIFQSKQDKKRFRKSIQDQLSNTLQSRDTFKTRFQGIFTQ